MKKMILMLMAMVVFGNVLGGWDLAKYDVLQIAFIPPNSNLTSTITDGGIFFTNKENPAPSDWFVFHKEISTDLSGVQKGILALLMNAQSNGKKVLVDATGNNITIDGYSYRSFSALKLVN